METKIFEIRDAATMIPAVAVRISGEDGALARSSGYGSPCVLLTRLQGGKACYDVYDWGSRTMTTAHNHIAEHWTELPNGAVVDVEFLLGERPEPKASEFGDEGVST